MPSSKKQILSLLLVFLLSLGIYFIGEQSQSTSQKRLLASNYTTSTSRSASVTKFCSALSRTTLVDSSVSAEYSLFNSQISSMLTMDGNAFVTSLLSLDYTSAKTQAQSSWVQLALFIGPFVVGLVLMVLLSPFVLCCCACPGSCPAKCCRKNQDEQYTNCELYWPVVVVLLALLLAIGACIAGFSQSQMITTTYNSVSCASSIILDDILNGNVTLDGSSFFVGLNQFYTQLGYLNANLSSINNTMANLTPNSSNMTTITNAATTALTNIAMIPNNVNSGGNMPAVAYSTPSNSASPTSTINSIFPSILGSSTTGGYVGALYTAVSSAKTAITAISNAANNFVSETSNYQSGITQLQSTLLSFTNLIKDTDNLFYNTLSTGSTDTNYVVTGMKVLYAATIAVASLMLLGVLLISFCDKINCRYLLYFACFILFWIGLLGFALSVLFSLLTPTVYFGCQFMSYSLSSSANFNNNFASLITNSTSRGYISTCLPGSSGDLATALGGSSIAAIQNLSSALTSMGNFNTTYQGNLLLSAMNQVTTVISNYKSGVVDDTSDTSSISILTKISNASAYSSCTTSYFATDSWIPSVVQSPTYVGCLIANGNNAISASCGGSNFTSAGGSCNGCLDITSIFNTGSYANKAAVLNALNSRYTAAGCSTFNSQLANVWNNYYLIKSNAYSPVSSRASTANTKVNTFVTNITTTLNATFSNAVTSLNAVAQSVTDSKYGLVAGMNCKVIGEDFTTFTTTFCQSLFTVLYFSRLVVGCASFGILFAICCGACTGVRFYKQSIRKLNSIDNTGLSDNEVEDITNMNFVKPKILQ